MLAMKSSARDDGAVAIEYAVIGALIGIGLIGALVGTRGSLSAIFGTASSAMVQAAPPSGLTVPYVAPRSVAAANTSS